MAYVAPINELTADEIARKYDAMALAKLMLDIYRENERKAPINGEEKNVE